MINKYVPKNNFNKLENIEAKLMVGKETNDNIYISFFVPTFDRIDTLIEAINSITSLKELDTIEYEIIVVDNSANFTEDNKIYQFFRKTEIQNLKYYINTENIGLFNNWNRGIQLSKGKYIAYLHDDDLLNENYLVGIKKCIAVGEKKGKLGFIHTKKTTFYKSDSIPKAVFKNRGGIRSFRMLDPVILGVGPTCAPTCGTIFLREALLKAGGFDEDLWPSADQLIGEIIINNGYRGYITEDSLGYYRVACNASLNPNTIKGVIEKDYYISNSYYYHLNFISKIWGGIFEDAQYSYRIDIWVNNAKQKYNVQIQTSDLDFRKVYKKKSIRKYILKIITKIYVHYNLLFLYSERGVR